ncbi:hypothetical protein CWT12_06585 [Actinomyces sp. 432]|uniref:DUF4326 domain-containing protein n=1 Tax=Actinomyces sp. 432 TaxID=2057798 RepID=UPI001373A493|nr:DUF4326 domain-containing protein [Actinomyces sp. 432]QHO91055.1 hypothetical protein CWT12_06585 [Actinomyces sp. 432]
MSPRRIQRRRTRGWRMPGGAVYVGRPSRWGNPFAVGGEYRVDSEPGAAALLGVPGPGEAVLRPQTRREAAVAYLAWLCWDLVLLPAKTGPVPPLPAIIVGELAGRDLACWCPLDEPCHADVLLAVAAGDPQCAIESLGLSTVVEPEDGVPL